MNGFSIVKYYSTPIVISIGTALFGLVLILSRNNVVDRIDLFPSRADVYFGLIMIVLAFIKLMYLFKKDKPKYKKYVMVAIAVSWLVISWFYAKYNAPSGFIMSGTLTALCYVELWRSDYTA